MAEAWGIIGIAVNIATLVDLGLKLVAAGISAHNSSRGTTREIETLSVHISDIRSRNSRLQTTRLSQHVSSKTEEAIRKLADECDQLVEDILRILDKLVIRDKAPSRRVESGRVAIQSWWKRNEVEALKARLLVVDTRLRDSVNDVLSE